MSSGLNQSNCDKGSFTNQIELPGPISNYNRNSNLANYNCRYISQSNHRNFSIANDNNNSSGLVELSIVSSLRKLFVELAILTKFLRRKYNYNKFQIQQQPQPQHTQQHQEINNTTIYHLDKMLCYDHQDNCTQNCLLLDYFNNPCRINLSQKLSRRKRAMHSDNSNNSNNCDPTNQPNSRLSPEFHTSSRSRIIPTAGIQRYGAGSFKYCVSNCNASRLAHYQDRQLSSDPNTTTSYDEDHPHTSLDEEPPAHDHSCTPTSPSVSPLSPPINTDDESALLLVQALSNSNHQNSLYHNQSELSSVQPQHETSTTDSTNTQITPQQQQQQQQQQSQQQTQQQEQTNRTTASNSISGYQQQQQPLEINEQSSGFNYHGNRHQQQIHNISSTNNNTNINTANNYSSSSRSCYFCWCCCCSCSCLNVKPKLEEPLRSQISNEPQSRIDIISMEERVTLEEAQKWAQNFDLIMQNKAGSKIFHEFLKLEYSEENIMFYRAVEELQCETNPDQIEEKARSIYEDYISILSPKEVSLDSKVREVINTEMVNPTKYVFDEAKLQIYTLMQRDSYPRFINSRLYKDFIHSLGGGSAGLGCGGSNSISGTGSSAGDGNSAGGAVIGPTSSSAQVAPASVATPLVQAASNEPRKSK